MKDSVNVTKRDGGSGIKMVVLVRCAIALERCSGFHCTWAFERRRDYFSEYASGVMAVSMSCGGCPGRRLSRLLSNVAKCAKKKEGWDMDNSVVHLTACVVNDSGHYPRCPFVDYMKAIIRQKGFKVIEGGYESVTARGRREQKQYQYSQGMRVDPKRCCDGVLSDEQA